SRKAARSSAPVCCSANSSSSSICPGLEGSAIRRVFASAGTSLGAARTGACASKLLYGKFGPSACRHVMQNLLHPAEFRMLGQMVRSLEVEPARVAQGGRERHFLGPRGVHDF